MKRIKTLLLIDDDVDDLDFFSDALKFIAPHIRCMTANDSRAALDAFKKHEFPDPDLIFLDLNMPVIDGKLFLTEIKKLAKYAHVPVIIYSTSSHPRDVYDTHRLGAAYFLPKPNSLVELREGLKHILSINWSEIKEEEFYHLR